MIHVTGKRIGLLTSIVSVVLLAVFETLRPHPFGSDSLWQARVAVLGTGLLFGNLLFLWWYASLTRDLAVAAREQVSLLDQQRRAAARPCVVIKEGGPNEISATNIGSGLAVNVVVIENVTGHTPTFASIGALGPAREIALDPGLSPSTVVPIDWERTLVWIASESSDRSEWVMTATRWKHPSHSARKEAEAIVATGYPGTVVTNWAIEHRVVVISLPHEAQLGVAQVSSVEWLRMAWPGLKAQLDPLRRI